MPTTSQLKRFGSIALVLLIGVGGYLVNRTPSGPPIDPILLDDTYWDIVTINDDLSSGWIRFHDETVSFTSGLNNISFRYEIDGDRLVAKDGEIFSTLVGSPNPYRTANEQRLTRAMNGGRMRLDGNQLTVGNEGATVVAMQRGQ